MPRSYNAFSSSARSARASTHQSALVLRAAASQVVEDDRRELLIMLDQTRDESLQVIKRHYVASNLSHHLRVWQSDVPLWEARGEAWLMKHATATHYFISVQPDHLITEPGWDRALVRPFEQYDDVFAVSARCAHDAPTVSVAQMLMPMPPTPSR